MELVLKIWLMMVLPLGLIALMSWVHRSWLKGFLSAMIAGVILIPCVYIIMIPMALLGHFLSSLFPEDLRIEIFDGIGIGGTALITIALFVWYCVTQRQISGFSSAPANAYRISEKLHPRPFRRGSL